MAPDDAAGVERRPVGLGVAGAVVGAEQPAVQPGQGLEGLVWDRGAVLGDGAGPQRQGHPVDGRRSGDGRGGRIHHLDGRRHDLRSDAVAFEDPESIASGCGHVAPQFGSRLRGRHRAGRLVDLSTSWYPALARYDKSPSGRSAPSQPPGGSMATGLPRIDLSSREMLTMEVARRLLDYFLSGEVEPGMRIPSERR